MTTLSDIAARGSDVQMLKRTKENMIARLQFFRVPDVAKTRVTIDRQRKIPIRDQVLFFVKITFISSNVCENHFRKLL